jgi:hypothetical protein
MCVESRQKDKLNWANKMRDHALLVFSTPANNKVYKTA